MSSDISVAINRVYPRACGATASNYRAHTQAGGLSPRMRGNRTAVFRRVPFLGSIPAHAGQPLHPYRIVWKEGVYPRACGATTLNSKIFHLVAGLSPRMRGNLLAHHKPRFYTGSIPAHAGQPFSNKEHFLNTWVYPRACGATDAVALELVDTLGLSPRMRGNRIKRSADGPTQGSIPAHAGQPRNDVKTDSQFKVYPRACGATSRA